MQKISLAVYALIATSQALKLNTCSKTAVAGWGDWDCDTCSKPVRKSKCACDVCHSCPCACEFKKVYKRVDDIEEALDDIKVEQDAQGDKLQTVVNNTVEQGVLLGDIDLKVDVVGEKVTELIDSLNDGIGSGPDEGQGCVININCNGCSDPCDCECPECPEPPVGNPDPEPVDPCTSPDNALEAGEVYSFSQGYPTGSCEIDFWLYSPSLLFDDE